MAAPEPMPVAADDDGGNDDNGGNGGSRMAAYVLRGSFAALTRREEYEQLRRVAGLWPTVAMPVAKPVAKPVTMPVATPVATPSVAVSAVTPTAAVEASHEGMREGSESAGVAELSGVLLAACAEGEARLVHAAITAPASTLLAALAHAAASEPKQMCTLLTSGLGRAGAFAIGQKLQHAQSGTPEAAARAVADIECAFACVGAAGSEAQHMARERLLTLEREFTDAAAARVLRETLGVDLHAMVALTTAVTPSGGVGHGGLKRKREEETRRRCTVAIGVGDAGQFRVRFGGTRPGERCRQK